MKTIDRENGGWGDTPSRSPVMHLPRYSLTLQPIANRASLCLALAVSPFLAVASLDVWIAPDHLSAVNLAVRDVVFPSGELLSFPHQDTPFRAPRLPLLADVGDHETTENCSFAATLVQ